MTPKRLTLQLPNRIPIIVFLPLLLFLIAGCREGEWAPERIETLNEILIPDDAVDISYSGNHIYGGNLELRFSAPPEGVSEFVETICDGVLVEGYDPFNAIDTADPVPGSILIKLPRDPHYSHSPNTPATTLGNRCIGNGAVEYEIAVDRSNPNLYDVRFEIPGAFTDFTLLHGSATYINPIHGSVFPLMVIGMAYVEGEFVLTHREVCMETQTGYYYQENWFPEEYYGADVQILVDDEPLVPAYIPEDRWELTPQYDAEGNAVQPSLWNYCFTHDWSSGLHTMTLNVTTADGTEHTFSWQFRIEESE